MTSQLGGERLRLTLYARITRRVATLYGLIRFVLVLAYLMCLEMAMWFSAMRKHGANIIASLLW